MKHVCFIYIFILIQKVTSDFQPNSTYQPRFHIENDINEGRFTDMTCDVSGATCDLPSYVYLEKQIEQTWHNACRLNDNNSYDPYPMVDGNTVEGRGRVFYNGFTQVYFFALNLTNLKDNGKWRCNLMNCGDVPLPSNDEKLTVSTSLTSSDVNITSPAYILLNRSSEYTCYSGRVYPEVNVSWTKAGELSLGTPKNIFNGEYWEIENTNTFRFCDRSKAVITCILDKSSGNNNWSVNNTADSVPIFAPAIIEDFTAIDRSLNISDTLIIPCTASGTSRTITWYKDGTVLKDDGLFERSDVNVTGVYTCGETEATESTLTWIQVENPTCENVHRHEGKYICVVNADKDTTDRSDEKGVTVLYPPFVPYAFVIVHASIDDVLTLICHVDCAMPSVLTYSWMRENNQEDIGENTPSIEIIITEQDFNTTIRCTVNNDVGTNYIRFIITEKKFPYETTLTEQPTATTTPYTTETTTDPKGPESPNQALVTAFAVIWSLCGVFAILLVCLVLYHYRQIQNGKTYNGEYSEELVLTEDEAQPGTSHGSGVYDDISPGIVSKGSDSGAVGGVTNEGLYAEVQMQAQTKMPVAPQRASKIKASQPNTDTQKTKRTQAPIAPKSPINARLQPSSTTERRPGPTPDYTPVNSIKQIQPQHSNETNHGPASNFEQQQKRQESPYKTAAAKQNTNGAKPCIPFKPNITSVRSSRSGAASAQYDNADVKFYANCDQRPVQKNADGTLTYADLDLQKEDPYDEGAPSVPAKHMTDQEPVQYASIKHNY